MSWVKDTFFGGAEKDAAEQQMKAYEQGQDIIQENIQQARSDIMNLFPAAEQNLLAGAGAALDVFNQITPAQAQMFQQGNVGAQNVLAGALPQMQNAILGGQVDYSFMQPQQFNIPTFNYAMPEFQTSQAALNQAAQPTPVTGIGPVLGGSGGAFGANNRYPLNLRFNMER